MRRICCVCCFWPGNFNTAFATFVSIGRGCFVVFVYTVTRLKGVYFCWHLLNEIFSHYRSFSHTKQKRQSDCFVICKVYIVLLCWITTVSYTWFPYQDFSLSFVCIYFFLHINCVNHFDLFLHCFYSTISTSSNVVIIIRSQKYYHTLYNTLLLMKRRHDESMAHKDRCIFFSCVFFLCIIISFCHTVNWLTTILYLIYVCACTTTPYLLWHNKIYCNQKKENKVLIVTKTERDNLDHCIVQLLQGAKKNHIRKCLLLIINSQRSERGSNYTT